MLFLCRKANHSVNLRTFIFFRKEILWFSPKQFTRHTSPNFYICGKKRAPFFAALKGSLTVEAAIALSVFFLIMTSVLQIGNVLGTAIRLGSAVSEAGEQIAIAAYVSEYGETSPIIRGSLSAVYAQAKVMKQAGDTKAVKNPNFLLSSFLKEEQMIHLVMTYQMNSVIGGIKLPGIFFLQRGSVRAWTGREGSGDGSEAEGAPETSSPTVYVAEHGTVYHTDIHCSHIRLSIRQVALSSVKDLRNTNGAKYHSCERCGKLAGSRVYITEDGNRYHSSLECSGLKRSIHEVSLDEIGNLRPCSRCGQLIGG